MSFQLLPFLTLLLLLSTSSVVGQTDTPTLHAPSSSNNAAISGTFVIDYTLPENALAGSAKFEMDPFPDDGKGQRVITFGSAALSAGRHTITITPFDNIQADNTLVSSVTCGVADCTPTHGSAFLFIFAYTGTEVGDAQATSQTDVLYIDLQTQPITLTTPSNDIFVATGFNVQFDKPEEALSGSLTLTVSRTGGTADSAADRIVTLSSSMETQTGSSAIVSMSRLEFLASTSPSLVSSVVPATDLVTGTIYTLTVSYRDKANNDPVTSAATGITFDGATEDPTVFFPTSTIPTFAESFLFQFSLPEEASPSTLRMKISATDETAGGPVRTVVFVDGFNQPGGHSTTFGPLSLIAASNADIVSVTPSDDLVNNQEYVIGVAYQDLRGNQEAEVLVAPIRLDTETLPLSVQQPVTGSRLALQFQVELTLPEDALPGSVQLLFVPNTAAYGGATDTTGQRVVVLASSMESTGAHTFMLTQLAGAAASVAEVASVTPSVSLVHAVRYDLTVRYQDRAGNSFQNVLLTNLQCDVETDPIVSIHPDQSLSSVGTPTFMDSAFTVQLTLPEAAATGSFTLAIEPTGSDFAGVADFELPRTIVFVDTIGAASGTKTVVIGDMSSPDSSNVVSITPAVDLIDGVVYQFTYSYSDTHGNTAATTVLTGIRYAGSITQRPTLTSPSSGTVLPSPFNLVFHLPERPYSGTVKLTIIPTGGTYIDEASSRVVILDSTAVANSGDYTLSITELSTLASTASYITSVEPATNLVDGALYSMVLSYQDGANHALNISSSFGVAFAGFETLPLILDSPPINVTMANAFIVNYTLSETALRGSVILLLTYAFGNDPVTTPRTIVFSEGMESPGRHVVQMQELSTAGGLTAIDTITPASDLIDGTQYDLLIKYQDGAANTAFQVSQPGMYFAGTATMDPVWTYPQGTSSLPAAFPVNYRLPERPTPGTVQIIMSRTDGLPDPAGTRIITFSSLVEDQNVWQNFSMNALSLINTTVPQVASIIQSGVLCGTQTVKCEDLIDGTQYRFTFQYEDFGQNPVSQTVKNLIYYSGAGTLLPTFVKPVSATYLGSYFEVDYTLPEPALPGTVFLEFERTGGLQDDNSPHKLYFDEELELPTQHRVNLQPFSNVSALSFVRSASSNGQFAQDLIDGSIYSVTLSYQDGGGNPAATQLHINVIFAGSTTKPANVTLPLENSTVKVDFDIRFELPEDATQESVYLKIIPELHSGCNDAHGTRSLRLASAVETAGQYLITMDQITLAVSNVPAIQTASPLQDLIHMCTYTVGIEYRDRAPNEPLFVGQVGIQYDILTETPSLTLPSSNTIITTTFTTTIVLPEVAASGSLQMTMTRTSGIDDAGSPHVLTFSDTLPDTYTFTMDTLSTLASSASFMTSITSGGNAVASDLMDGATYDVLLRYVDQIENSEATVSASSIFFAGSTTLAPTFARPTENVRLPQQFVIDFTLNEPAHPGTLTMTFTPNNELGATDANGARVITFDASFETSGRHQLSADRLSQLSNLAGVTSVSPAVDLVNDGVYEVVLSYRDTAQHESSSVAHANVTFDTVTSPPTLTYPATLTRAKNEFTLDFTLPENVLDNSLELDLTYLSGAADAVTTRSITFDDSIEVLGNHPFTMTNLSLAGDNVGGIEAVTPAIDLVHGALYIFTLKYRDYLGNDQASDESTSILFDTHTISPAFDLPASDAFLRVDFQIDFQLLEPALVTTVILEIQPKGTTSSDHIGNSLAPSVDTGSDLVLTFGSSFETVSTHTITSMVRLEIAVSSIAAVSGITPTARDLIHGNIYDMTLSYRDQADNIRAAVIHTNLRFDTQTETPELFLPTTGSFLQDPFLVDFTLREQANAGSVVLKIIPSGVGETDSAGTRTITLTTAQETFGNRQFDLGPSLASAGTTNSIEVASITPSTDLVDGCVYDFRIQYVDVAGNTMAYQDVANVAYAAMATLPPLLSSPASNSAVRTNFEFDFSLREVALPGSLTLSIVPVSGSDNVQDSHGTRVVTFASSVEGRGGHIVQMLNLSVAALESPNIALVQPAIDLKIGALYNLILSYQDAAGNPAETVTHTSIAFAGNATLSPVLVQPQTFDYVGDSFTTSFVLPERSLEGSVKLVFIYDTARSIVADGVSERTVTFDHSFTANAGTYTLLFPTMSTGSQLSSIASVVPAADLVDGGVYTIRLEYQDAAGNPKALVSHEEIAYVGIATILPIVHVPESLTKMKERFPVDFTITEYALPGTVHLTFIPMTADSNGIRRIFLTSEFERPGRYNFTMEALSTSDSTMTQVSSITTKIEADSSIVSGAPNLLDGSLYRVTINYQDRAGNPGIDENGNSIEFGTSYSTDVLVDLISPVISEILLDLSYGILRIETLEHVNLNDTYWYGAMLGLDLTQIYLSQTTSGNDISIGNGKLVSNTIETEFHYKRWGTTNITVVLTEAQRIASILASGTPGGDGTALVLDVYVAAMRDLAGNPNVGQTNLVVRESADTIPPVLLGATLHLGNGTIIITAGEVIDTQPAANVDLTKMTLVNILGSADAAKDVELVGSTVTEEHSLEVTLTLTQTQRARAVEISNTPGGDNEPTILSCVSGAFVDIGKFINCFGTIVFLCNTFLLPDFFFLPPIKL